MNQNRNTAHIEFRGILSPFCVFFVGHVSQSKTARSVRVHDTVIPQSSHTSGRVDSSGGRVEEPTSVPDDPWDDMGWLSWHPHGFPDEPVSLIRR